jgi:SAM-dependent methyltransferase
MTSNHFDTIADIYNKVWYFSAQYQNSMLSNIIELLSLKPDDILADVGGGTGVYTRLLRDAVSLQRAYCIEPSRGMCAEAAKLESIESFCADAAGFIDLNLSFSKVLLKEVVHHIPARETLWQYLHKALPADGKLLIVTRPQAIALPLFEQAKVVFRQKQPHHEALIAELEANGFTTVLKFHPYVFSLDKQTWFNMIKNRFMSDLSGFTENEIEAGIQEINLAFPETKITIPDTIIYIAATPKP